MTIYCNAKNSDVIYRNAQLVKRSLLGSKSQIDSDRPAILPTYHSHIWSKMRVMMVSNMLMIGITVNVHLTLLTLR